MLKGQKLQQAYDTYINDYSLEKGLEAKTIRNKKDILGKLIPFMNDRPFTLDACRDYAFFMYENGWDKPNSRLNIIKNLRAFINFLHERGYIKENFSRRLVKPKVTRLPLQLPKEIEAEKCILVGTEPGKGDNSRNRRIKQETRLCLQFMLRTGLRISEALYLKGSDLSPFDEQPSFQVRSKGGDIDISPIPLDMVEIMKERVNRLRVFETTEQTCNKNLRDGVSKIGIPIPLTCHKLRHIFSISRLRRGNTVQMVSRALRHSNIEITDKYYSNYVLSDVSDVVNDSPIIKNGLTPYQVIERGLQAFKKAVEDDVRINLTINNDTQGKLIIRTSIKDSIL